MKTTKNVLKMDGVVWNDDLTKNELAVLLVNKMFFLIE
jgi:hypothetical protein